MTCEDTGRRRPCTRPEEKPHGEPSPPADPGAPASRAEREFCCLSTFGVANTWRRLESSLDSKYILKEISPEYSLEGLMLKLKFLYFGHLMRRADSLEKTPMLGLLKAGGEGDNRGWDGWMASPTQWT